MANPDTFTDEQLTAMKQPSPAKRSRRTPGLSQNVFAERFGISLRTLQDWEQECRSPDVAAASNLREREPDVVAGVLAGGRVKVPGLGAVDTGQIFDLFEEQHDCTLWCAVVLAAMPVSCYTLWCAERRVSGSHAALHRRGGKDEKAVPFHLPRPPNLDRLA